MKDALELDTRRKIFQHVSKKPGAHLRSMEGDLNLAVGQLEYHLSYLIKAGLLSIEDDGFRKGYFVSSEISHSDKPVISILRQKVPRRIIIFILLNPGCSFQELTKEFGVSKSTMSFHLKKLVTNNILVKEKSGRQNVFKVSDPDYLAKLILTYKESFVDRVVDRFASAWVELE